MDIVQTQSERLVVEGYRKQKHFGYTKVVWLRKTSVCLKELLIWDCGQDIQATSSDSNELNIKLILVKLINYIDAHKTKNLFLTS